MARIALLIVALLFIAGLGVLTAIDLARHGVNALNVLSIAILVLFATGIVGALRRPPREPPQ